MSIDGFENLDSNLDCWFLSKTTRSPLVTMLLIWNRREIEQRSVTVPSQKVSHIDDWEVMIKAHWAKSNAVNVFLCMD